MKTALVGILLFVLLVGTEGYPPQGRLMPDGAPVPEDAAEHEDSVASASEVGEEYEDGDDSDMYMEPDASETVRPDQEPVADVEKSAEPVTERQKSAIPDQEAKNTDVAQTNPDSGEKSLETESQNFFPSFAELFANHRLPFSEQQQRFRPNRFLGYFQRDRGAYQAATSNNKEQQHPLLGSGNFGVIRGGTYYPEDKENDEYNVDESLYSPYYHGSRSRANYFRNPKPQPVRGGDFFANFRDFADITAPPKSSFSHLSVVYANKNGSSPGRITEPRNIIETLRMLEEEDRASSASTTTTEVPRKKQSKGKQKLLKLRQHEEDKARRSRMSVEPLLALS
ncbi:hypothetical protein KM043_006569 [Ampulex compressa]|nr:hypothetical protein KM043_006569 [Ampulex compressa]